MYMAAGADLKDEKVKKAMEVQFSMVDIDHDGRVTKEEFMDQQVAALLKRHKERRAEKKRKEGLAAAIAGHACGIAPPALHE
jgi:hypothetical protein